MKKIAGYIIIIIVFGAIIAACGFVAYKQGGWHDVVLSLGGTAVVLGLVVIAFKLIESK